MDITQIDKEIARLHELREQALKTELEKKRQEGLLEAREILGRLTDDLRRLDELGYLPPRLKDALTDEKEKFNPGLYIKRPKLGSENTP